MGDTMAARGRTVWRGIRQGTVLALVLTGLSAGGSSAATDDPVTAVFTACIARDLTVTERLDLLTDTGWRTPADGAEVRKLFALWAAIAIPLDSPENIERALLSYKTGLERKINTGPHIPKTFFMLRDVMQSLNYGRTFEAGMVPMDKNGLLLLRITKDTHKEDAATASCSILVSKPQPDGQSDKLEALAGPVDTLDRRESIPGIPTTQLDRADEGDGSALNVRLIEFTADAPHNRIFAEAALGTSISLRMASEHTGLPLR